MKVTRVFADEQGESHFAEDEIALTDAGPIGHLSEPIPAKSVIFRTNVPGYDYDWHVAPQRQFIVEDTTGKGHRTRHVEPRERHSVFIVLE